MSNKLAIVVPCYKEEAVLHETTKRLSDVLNLLVAKCQIDNDSFILYVNDGSTDQTWPIILQLHKENKYVCGVNLACNVGHQNALWAGLTVAVEHADMVVSIDADLQDDPNAIVEMVQKCREGKEIVYGVRSSRKTDTWFKRTTAHAFYSFQNVMGLETVYDHADYRLMSRRALELLSQYGEENLFLRGIVPQIGLDTDIVKYERNVRVAGESKYPLSKMLSFSIDGITSFSARPMRWIFMIGLILLVIDVFVAVYVLFAFVENNAVSGWTSLMLSVWFLGSLILMGLGIVGEYIGKIFIEVKNRPRYAIKDYLLD